MEDFYDRLAEQNYERIINTLGVRITICKNRFEVVCKERGEINEPQAIQAFKDWIAFRREEEVRGFGPVPEQLP
jgi:hypothetical protein